MTPPCGREERESSERFLEIVLDMRWGTVREEAQVKIVRRNFRPAVVCKCLPRLAVFTDTLGSRTDLSTDPPNGRALSNPKMV